MARSEYRSITGADVALAAATAKTILGIKAGASFGCILRKAGFYFDGIAAAAEPVLVELCYATFATNAPGTNSTSVTPAQTGGRVLAHGFTAARAWSAEPTVLTVLDEMLVHPQMGVKEWFPPGSEYDSALGEGFALRATAPAIVNIRGVFLHERG
jgi:hypothetical protein